MTDCAICSGSTRQRNIGGTAFRVCRRCGYGQLVDIAASGDYWPDSIGHVSSFWTEAKSGYFLSALELLEQLTSGRRLLDFGGGVGHFARLALERGWDAYSFDVSEAATKQAGAVLGPERALLTLDDVSQPFDAITLWCVVAHVDDPVSLLGSAAEVLARGGVVWVTTPNFTFQKPYARARAVVRRPITFAADDHIGHFTPRALDSLSRRAVGPMKWYHRGITEYCAMTEAWRGPAVVGKRAWNAVAATLMRAGGPNFTSELQGVARKDAASITVSP